jgi:HAD superfamily hydrolase (TIGR01509 family)
MNERRIDAALFDWSGTLVDDLRVVWETNNRTLMSFGLPYQNLQRFRERFFLPWQEFYGTYGLGSEDSLREVDSRFWRTYQQLSLKIKPFSQTRSALKSLKDLGLKTAVVTQTKKAPLLDQVARFGFEDLIDAAVGAEDATELKPSAKPILAALERLGVEPSKAIFTGDMVEDVIAGKNAGVKVISIVWKGSYHTEQRIREKRPDLIAHDLYEVVRILREENEL